MIILREVNQEDFEFLFYLKKKSLQKYIQQTGGWDKQWQRDYFSKNFNPEELKIIVQNDQDIGVISIIDKVDKLLLSKIEILPTFQNRGIGTSLIKDILKRANLIKKNVILQVHKLNKRVKILYERLGFVIVDENEIHYFMEYEVKK